MGEPRDSGFGCWVCWGGQETQLGRWTVRVSGFGSRVSGSEFWISFFFPGLLWAPRSARWTAQCPAYPHRPRLVASPLPCLAPPVLEQRLFRACFTFRVWRSVFVVGVWIFLRLMKKQDRQAPARPPRAWRAAAAPPRPPPPPPPPPPRLSRGPCCASARSCLQAPPRCERKKIKKGASTLREEKK